MFVRFCGRTISRGGLSYPQKLFKTDFKYYGQGNSGPLNLQQAGTVAEGEKHTKEFALYFINNKNDGAGGKISPWHDISLYTDESKKYVNFITEIPKGKNAKMEIQTSSGIFNCIKQDIKNGNLRYIQHGNLLFNYGALPQTYEDPEIMDEDTGYNGDGDPLDVVEIGETSLEFGSITPVKILGCLALIDEDETDWKIITIRKDHPLADKTNDIPDVEKNFPNVVDCIRDWYRVYKVAEGKPENTYGFGGEAKNKEYAENIVKEMNHQWLNYYNSIEEK